MKHLYDRLKKYAESDYYPYHMPGHKRRLSGELPEQIFGMDITEIEDFDNLHDAKGILRRLQEKAARLYGAEESFYLINGSTCGILSAVSAALPVGGHILMARNCHKSAYHAAYLRNLTISYLYPDEMKEYDINDVISPKQVGDALKKESDIGAVLLVSPTYEGRISDVEGIARIVHEKGIPLIVDEAHGAHLGWVGGFGRNSCQSGADLVVHSVHKTLPAMTQTALLHVNGSLVDRDKLRRFLHIYQSSSPSYVLMASIDNALELVEQDGRRLFADFVKQYGKMLDSLSKCRHLDFLRPEEGRQDVGKLVISAKRFGLSGHRLYDMLLQEYHLQLEMAGGTYCLAMFTVGDGAEAYQRMTEALVEIDGRMENGSIRPDLPKAGWAGQGPFVKKETAVGNGRRGSKGAGSADSPEIWEGPDTPLPLGTAWDMEAEYVPLGEATDRYVAEFINLYPPGTPLLVPGERLTAEKYRQILFYLNHHLEVQGVEKLDDIQIIKVLRK